MARFVFAEPSSGKILFSSVSLPVEWAQGRNFFDEISKHNSTSMMKKIGKAFTGIANVSFDVRLCLSKDGIVDVPQNVKLSVTPMLQKRRKVSGVIVLFSV